jgi:hypothetical protein
VRGNGLSDGLRSENSLDDDAVVVLNHFVFDPERRPVNNPMDRRGETVTHSERPGGEFLVDNV